MAPFSGRSRLFTTRRILLALTLTCIVFFYGSNSPSNLQARLKTAGTKLHLSVYKPSRNEAQQALHEEQSSTPESYLGEPSSAKTIATTPGIKKVSLEAHIMSKCPDVRDCLRDLVVPAMSQISPLVSFKLFYIGELASDKTSTVTCKHGPSECLGNSISLCAQHIYAGNGSDTSDEGTKKSLGFTNCLLKHYKRVPERELVEQCAMEHAVDFEKVNNCVSGEGVSKDVNGEELLRNSVIASKERGVKYSCTVRLDEDHWVIRDDGEWKFGGDHGGSVEALVAEIQQRAGH